MRAIVPRVDLLSTRGTVSKPCVDFLCVMLLLTCHELSSDSLNCNGTVLHSLLMLLVTSKDKCFFWIFFNIIKVNEGEY